MNKAKHNHIPTRHLSSKELSDRWGMSIQTLYNWVALAADLPPSIKIGGKRRWALRDVENWENERKEETKGGDLSV